MDVVLTMQITLEGQVGERVAGPVELFHRSLQLTPRFQGDNELRFDAQFQRFHEPDITAGVLYGQQMFHRRKDRRFLSIQAPSFE